MTIALVLFGPLFGQHGARAQETPEALAFEAPEGCATRTDFDAHLHQFLGLEPSASDPLAGSRVALAVVPHAPSGFAMTLDLWLRDGSTSHRVVTHPTRCDLLVEVGALIVAMAIDPEAALEHVPAELLASGVSTEEASETPPAPPEPAAQQALAPPPEEPPAEAPSAAPDAAEPNVRQAFALGLRGGISTGAVASHAPVLGLDLAYERAHLRVGLALLSTGPGTVDAQGIPGGALRTYAPTIALLGCYVALEGRVTLPLCGRVEAGVLVAEPHGVPSPTNATRGVVRIGLEPGVRIALVPWLALLVRASLGGALLRPSFSVHGAASPVYSASWLAFDATLGLEARLR